jgi:hypothetical protein
MLRKIKRNDLYKMFRKVASDLGVQYDLSIKFPDFFDAVVEFLIIHKHLPKNITTDETLLDVYDNLYMKASSFWENQMGRFY